MPKIASSSPSVKAYLPRRRRHQTIYRVRRGCCFAGASSCSAIRHRQGEKTEKKDSNAIPNDPFFFNPKVIYFSTD